MIDSEFPELAEFKAMQRQRHRKVIAGLIAGGLVSLCSGLAIFAFAGGGNPAYGGGAVGVVLIGVGVVLIGRGVVSAVTDLDTRARVERPAGVEVWMSDQELDATDDGDDKGARS